jgi:hypothetical protein
MADYTVHDVIYRDGGVSIIVNITALDKDIYVNNSIKSFERMTEYEVMRMIDEVVERYLTSEQLLTTDKESLNEKGKARITHADNIKNKIKGNHVLGESNKEK